jgi:hypothetical protein
MNSPNPSNTALNKKTPQKQNYKGPLSGTQQINQMNGNQMAERVKTHQINKSLGGQGKMQ